MPPSNAGVRNFAVPSYTLSYLLRYRGAPGEAIQDFGPPILLNAGTQAAQVRGIDPSLVVMTIGGNDVFDHLFNDVSVGRVPLTGAVAYANGLQQMVRALTSQAGAVRGADVAIGTVPNILDLPVMVPVGGVLGGFLPGTLPHLPFRVAAATGMMMRTVDRTAFMSQLTFFQNTPPEQPKLAIPSGSYMYMNSFLATYYGRIMAGRDAEIKLEEGDFYFLPAELKSIQNRIQQYNNAIKALARRIVNGNRVVAFDIAEEFAGLNPARRNPVIIRANIGARARTVVLDNTYSGGAVSIDGIHPTATGQAIVANILLYAIQETKLDIGGLSHARWSGWAPVDVGDVFSKDLFNPRRRAFG